VDDAWEKQLDEDLAQEIGATIKEVEAMPAPPRASLFSDVYAELPRHLREQRDELERLPPAPSHGG
jgi:pyruvate dehydrogenase E1 component alpha subunit/2-oxoisovalerate dehydrogenase E1 component alpha subunit